MRLPDSRSPQPHLISFTLYHEYLRVALVAVASRRSTLYRVYLRLYATRSATTMEPRLPLW